jgi:hypothetical protein
MRNVVSAVCICALRALLIEGGRQRLKEAGMAKNPCFHSLYSGSEQWRRSEGDIALGMDWRYIPQTSVPLVWADLGWILSIFAVIRLRFNNGPADEDKTTIGEKFPFMGAARANGSC